MLNLNAFSTFAIEKPPLRGNISYQFAHLSKDKPLETVDVELLLRDSELGCNNGNKELLQ